MWSQDFLKPYLSARSRLVFVENRKALFKFPGWQFIKTAEFQRKAKKKKKKDGLFSKWLDSLLLSYTVKVQEIRQHCFLGLFRHLVVDEWKVFSPWRKSPSASLSWKQYYFQVCWNLYNLLENFPIGSVVNYLYCNDLFMFSIQDFLRGHKPLSYSLRRCYISMRNNRGLSYQLGIRQTHQTFFHD